MIATGAYKELTTEDAWKNYQSKFESTFKD